MQISEFSRQTGLPADTVRFYVKRGLLQPETGVRGGSNPYQIFRPEHVEAARLIKLAQSLGFTLRQIATIAVEMNSAGLTRQRKIAILNERLVELEDKATQISRMTRYLRAKIAWLEAGARGPEPVMDFGGGELSASCAFDATLAIAAPTKPAPRRRKALSDA